MAEQKITPRYVEVTPEEARGLFETSNEEAHAARSRLMARYALRTAENVPVIGVIMGDQGGNRVPARMIDLSPGDLGTALNPNKHFMPHPRQVEAKKVDTAEAPQAVVENEAHPVSWPEEDLDAQVLATEHQESNTPMPEAPLVQSEENDNDAGEPVIETDNEPTPLPEASHEEVVKEQDPLALTKGLTAAIVDHHPQAYLHNRETLVHVLTGQYGEELKEIQGGDVSDEDLHDIYEATSREVRDIKSEVGRLEEVSRKTTDLSDAIDRDLKSKAESYKVFEAGAQKAIAAYSELAKLLIATADDTETFVNNLRVGRPISRASFQEFYENIFGRQRAFDGYYDEPSLKSKSQEEAAATQLTSFQRGSQELDEGMGDIYRARNQEGDLSDASLSADEIADRVISLGNPSSVNALRSAVEDRIDDQVRSLKKKQGKIEDFVHTLAGVKNEADSLDMSVLPDKQELLATTQRLLLALDAYQIQPSAENKGEVIRTGSLLKNNVLDDLTIAKVRQSAGSNADFEQRLRATHTALNELES